jgi:hypothetical protein
MLDVTAREWMAVNQLSEGQLLEHLQTVRKERDEYKERLQVAISAASSQLARSETAYEEALLDNQELRKAYQEVMVYASHLSTMQEAYLAPICCLPIIAEELRSIANWQVSPSPGFAYDVFDALQRNRLLERAAELEFSIIS